MRLNGKTIIFLFCCFFSPAIVWILRLQFFGILVVILLNIIVVWANNLSKLAKRTPNNNKMILQTITVSHYSEKVRWCMDLLGEPYKEEQSAGIIGLLALGRTVPTLFNRGISLNIGNSSTILRYLWGEFGHKEKGRFLAADAKTLELEKKFDRMGVSVQRISYYYLLPHKELCCTLWGQTAENVPRVQRIILPIVFPFLKMFVTRGLKISERTATSELERVEDLLEEMDEVLKDGREHVFYVFFCWLKSF